MHVQLDGDDLPARAPQAVSPGLAAHDATPPSGQARGRRRLRLVALGSVFNATSKIAAGVTLVTAVAITSRYLGKERFGLWMTLSSFMTLLGFANFGLGSGLVNAISDALDDAAAVQATIVNGFVALAAISGALGLLFFSISPAVNWATFFNLHGPTAEAEVRTAVGVFVVVFLVNNTVGAIKQVQLGLQLAWRAYAWATAGQLVALAGLLVVVHYGGGIAWLLVAVSGGPVAVSAVNLLDFFLRSHIHLRPRLSLITRSRCRTLLAAGGIFMWLEAMALIGNASDNVVIARVLGASAVGSYAVAQKLVSALFLGQFFATPLWPAFGEALARGDLSWARETLKRTLWLSLALGLGSAGIVILLGRPIIAFWAGAALVPGHLVLTGCAALALLLPVSATLSAFLNTSRFVKKQIIYYPVAAVAALALKVLWTRQWQSAGGAVWATVAAFGCLFVVPGIWVAYRGTSLAATAGPGVAPS